MFLRTLQRSDEVCLEDLVRIFGMPDVVVCFCCVGAGGVEEDVWAAGVVADVGGYVVDCFVSIKQIRILGRCYLPFPRMAIHRSSLDLWVARSSRVYSLDIVLGLDSQSNCL